MQEPYNSIGIVDVFFWLVRCLADKADSFFLFQTSEASEDPHQVLLEKHQAHLHLIVVTSCLDVEFVRLSSILY